MSDVPTASTRHHMDDVEAVLQDKSISNDVDAVSGSWRRSAQAHRVDPESRERPRILTRSALRSFLEPIEDVVRVAQPELDRLHSIVGQADYITLLCDKNGIAVDHRANDQRASEFHHWGTCLGGVWGEDIEGTNGIGTCIAEGRAVTVHQTQHFRTRHICLSCSGAPIFDPDARLVAVLDVSSIDPDLSAQAHALTLPVVTMSARLIEERLFRQRFCDAWIIALAPHDAHPASLLAADRDCRVIAADRQARSQFKIDARSIARGLSVWDIFSRKSLLIQKGARADYALPLRAVHGDGDWFALVSPPLRTADGGAALLMQPRIDLLEDMRRRFEAQPPRGGLAPGALRRTVAYIELHLAGELTLTTIAAHVGLSTHHFARAFRQSMGVAPHRYILTQRIKRAAELLKETQLPLTAIAQAVGFADQSHFSRSFRSHLGMAPSAYRRLHE